MGEDPSDHTGQCEVARGIVGASQFDHGVEVSLPVASRDSMAQRLHLIGNTCTCHLDTLYELMSALVS